MDGDAPQWGPQRPEARQSWSREDTAAVLDTQRHEGGGRGHSRARQAGGGGVNQPRGAHRRSKGYRRLWEHVKSVGRGDQLDGDGRSLLPCEMSVEELVRVCLSLPPDASVVAAVAPALAYLDSRAMAAFMKELAKSQHLARAMELFDWLKALPPEHELYGLCDVYTFTTAISLMGPSQQLRRALELIGEMRTRGLQCNVHTYSALMNVCIKCDACDLALDVFKQMHEDKIRPNVVTYNTLVDVYGKTGQWDKAVRVLDEMRDQDLEPEVRTYNTAIIACNMCGQPQEALKVYQRLLEAGLQPISTTYTALISAYGKAGQLDKALETFHTMIRQGCERSVITYSALISACEKAGRWELALQLFDQMQVEGCAPNTVTYNSLITACQQGGQPDKACEVFEQMKYHGCRPDVVTYTALINAYNKAGQWHKAVRAFEQMQGHNCKPDSFMYQTVIDSLWQTGVAWAQARAWQLYAAAARNWQYRFTVQQAGGGGGRELEFVVPAFTPGVAVLALRKWLSDMAAQAEAGDACGLLGPGRERLVLSLGRSRHMKEPGSSAACAALNAVLQGFRSPFGPGSGAMTAAGNIVVAEASSASMLVWLRCPELPEYLALLGAAALAAAASSRQQPSPLGGGGQKRLSFAADLGEDAKLGDSCGRAYRTVLEVELGQLLQPSNMAIEYLAERPACVSAAFKLAEQLELPEEVAFDGVLLMDRVMSTGTQHDSSLSMLFVAAALRIAALQTVPGSSSDSASLSGLPSDALMAAAIGVPAGSVAKMEANMQAALGGDTKAISMLRCLKLYLERMGTDQQDSHINRGMGRLMRAAALEPVLLSCRPSVVAAAVLHVARAAVGMHPFFPLCLEQLTGMAGSPAGCSELAAAVAAVEPLVPAAALEPPPRPAALHPPHLALGGRPLSSSGHGQLSGQGSGYSTPGHAATPSMAAMVGGGQCTMPFAPGKSLLDAVVRQHTGLQRAGSDMSSLSAATVSDDSAADLQALLSASAAAAGSITGSPIGPPPVSPAASGDAGLAAAMAGLQLGMSMHGGMPMMQQQATFAPWLAPPGAGFPTPADVFHVGLQQQQQQQQQQGSRLQQMTSPYVLPMHGSMQHAMMMSNAGHLR